MATVTGTELQNFIGGEFVDAAEYRGRDQPVDRRGDRRRRPSRAPRTSTARSRAAREAFETWGSSTPALALGGAAGARRRDPRARRRVRRHRVRRRRQAAPGVRRRGARDVRRQPALLRRRRAQHGGQGRERVRRGLHLDDPARAGRRRRPDHPVELPADDGDVEDRPGVRRRLHQRAEAGREHAALDLQAGRDRGRHPAAGRAQRDRRPRRSRRRGDGHPRGRHGLADRLARRPASGSPSTRRTRSSASTSSSAARRR